MNEQDDFGIEQQAFQDLEHDFQEVIIKQIPSNYFTHTRF